MDESIVEALRSFGHDVETAPGLQAGWGPMSVIGLDGAKRETARDPRVETTTAIQF